MSGKVLAGLNSTVFILCLILEKVTIFGQQHLRRII